MNHHPKPFTPKPWTPADDAKLFQLHHAGLSYRLMALAMKRSRDAITSRCHKLGLWRDKVKPSQYEAAYRGRRYEDVRLRA